MQSGCVEGGERVVVGEVGEAGHAVGFVVEGVVALTVLVERAYSVVILVVAFSGP